MKKEKLYPFSGTKHGHDIDFRRARVKNEIYAIEGGEVKVDETTYNKMLILEEQLDELIGYMSEGVVWLPGRLYGLAQECVGWAASQRG